MSSPISSNNAIAECIFCKLASTNSNRCSDVLSSKKSSLLFLLFISKFSCLKNGQYIWLGFNAKPRLERCPCRILRLVARPSNCKRLENGGKAVFIGLGSGFSEHPRSSVCVIPRCAFKACARSARDPHRDPAPQEPLDSLHIPAQFVVNANRGQGAFFDQAHPVTRPTLHLKVRVRRRPCCDVLKWRR